MRFVYVWTIDYLRKRKQLLGDSALYGMCGGNTGNVCFCDAIYEQLYFDDEIRWFDIKNYEYDNSVFVFGASNWISLDGHVLKEIFLPLDRIECEFLVLGLGVNINRGMSIEDFVIELKKDSEIINSLKVLSAHSRLIGVRGNITGEVLNKLGIYNWRVIGCPSFYSMKLNDKLFKGVSLERCVTNVVQGKLGDNIYLEWGMQHNCSVILQCMNDMPKIIWNGTQVEQKHIDKRFPGNICIKPNQYYEYIKKNGKMFYTREKWSEFLEKKLISFAFGGRFHGNMMALTNGIPTLWIKRDIRIEELTDCMKLPIVDTKSFEKEMQDIADGKILYGKKFIDNYKRMKKGYMELLDAYEMRYYL